MPCWRTTSKARSYRWSKPTCAGRLAQGRHPAAKPSPWSRRCHNRETRCPNISGTLDTGDVRAAATARPVPPGRSMSGDVDVVVLEVLVLDRGRSEAPVGRGHLHLVDRPRRIGNAALVTD